VTGVQTCALPISKFETRSEIRNPESEIEVPEPRTPNLESRVGTASEVAQSKIQNPKSKIDGPRTPDPRSRALTALRVFRPSVPAQVEVRAESPVRIFSTCGARGEIVSASGPWRTSGDWWTDKAWEHDEWDVAVVSRPSSVVSCPLSVVTCGKQQATDGGRRIAIYRLYRDLSSGNWFVQGAYD